MGRNIFQSEAPKAMIAAVNAVVHKEAKAQGSVRAVQFTQSDGMIQQVPAQSARAGAAGEPRHDAAGNVDATLRAPQVARFSGFAAATP